ncbi:hypothetical protein Fot_37368 [Forsythia ovata]|uniref:Uncharacterized protein n=1 Tax=Forsythia ovata TaxID=205694 RepID=A0ABD1RYS7_9LAMI
MVGEGSKHKKKETSLEGIVGPISGDEAVNVATDPLQRTLSGANEEARARRKFSLTWRLLGRAGGESSREIFEDLIGKVGQRLPNEAIQNLNLQAALGGQAFNMYLPQSWKAFVTRRDMKDLLEASIAYSIRVASASMKSLNALKEYKKKMAVKAAKVAKFRAAMDSLIKMNIHSTQNIKDPRTQRVQ